MSIRCDLVHLTAYDFPRGSVEDALSPSVSIYLGRHADEHGLLLSLIGLHNGASFLLILDSFFSFLLQQRISRKSSITRRPIVELLKCKL